MGVLVLAVAACNQKSTPPPSPDAPADCDKVSEIITNFELGPAAKPETRTPVVANHREDCAAAKINVREATCIAKATSTWELMECAPRLFPQRASSTDCKAVAVRMREAIIADMPPSVGSAGVAMVDKMLGVMEASCREDNWPASFRECITAVPPGNIAAFKKCDDVLPQDMQLKLGERLKPIVNRAESAPK